MRPQPLISVVDVEASSRFYQHLLGCTSAHGGLEYERLVHGGRLFLQLHRFGVAHDHGAIGDPADRPYGNGVLLWFEIEDLDAAVARAEALGAEIVLPTHRNPLDGAGGPDHRECWLRDPDGYTVVLASPDGEASGWLPPLATRVAPQLSVRGGRAAIAFYAAAFGARTTYLVDAGDAVVAELAVGETTIWVSDESPEHGHSSPATLGGTSVRLLLVVADLDAAYAAALAAGALAVLAPVDEHGWRLGRVRDPFGHDWEIGRPLRPWPSA